MRGQLYVDGMQIRGVNGGTTNLVRIDRVKTHTELGLA
jgi:hypothetical protein